ncbi:MAG: molecular chaperone DnaJ [Candidatus Eremiobacteraeota bacterium]|nr:molecular chaperone DnaJ [Candidatus Eremiobacteraeota bacterium]MBV8498787.1 molecular chaperone DnaJ [Candidatus Eremiobacteraeota bacterium]
MPTKDYYEILGVAADASGDEIKRAYRKLAREHHPDVAHDKSSAEHRFKQINEAYEVLSDPNKRAQYDRFGVVGNGASGPGGFGFGGGSFGDIFDMFFGNMRGAAPRRAGPERGADLRYDVEISLEDAYTGSSREIVFDRPAACDACNGSGARRGTVVVACDRCGGSGMAQSVRHTPLGQIVTQSACPRCGGEGHVIPHPCEVCGGHGRRETQTRLTVEIPAGVDDGSRIRIAGNGEAGSRGGPPGDLYVYLSIAAHPLFTRNGRDTFVDVPVSFPQAALGATVAVPSLGGEVEVSIAPGTQSQTRLRLRGYGMPSVRGSQRGDHHVTIHVAVPTKLNNRQRDLLEQYARAGGDAIEERTFLERVKDAFRPD